MKPITFSLFWFDIVLRISGKSNWKILVTSRNHQAINFLLQLRFFESNQILFVITPFIQLFKKSFMANFQSLCCFQFLDCSLLSSSFNTPTLSILSAVYASLVLYECRIFFFGLVEYILLLNIYALLYILSVSFSLNMSYFVKQILQLFYFSIIFLVE